MSKKREPTILEDTWHTNAKDVPEPRELNKLKVADGTYVPFPLSLDTQKELLDLICRRESGIISRQELVDVLFGEKNSKTGQIIRYRY
tara:strand:+ start:618 stop:881 length:264 start_codon:yes stop_codon:yes gene_type:complete